MSQSQGQSAADKSPLKLALAVVLSVAFVVVLIIQFGGVSSGDDDARPESGGKARAQIPHSKRGTKAAGDDARTQPAEDSAERWPRVELADVLKYDPFATPPAFSDQGSATVSPEEQRRQAEQKRREELLQKQAEREKALEKLQKEGVKAILGSSRGGTVAVIGSRTIHVGDKLDGFRVVAIKPDGVVLQEPAIE